MRLAFPDLFSCFEKNATLVTPSHLLTEAAAEQFARSCVQQGLETWEQPKIYSMGAWLTICWRQARYNSSHVPILLSPMQEEALWHSIIEQERPDLFDVSATVRLAARAAKLLAEWQIPADGELWNEHADARQFQAWLRLFRRKCQEQSWITRADLWRLLPEWIAAEWVSPGLTVFLLFEKSKPALRNLQLALGDMAVSKQFKPATPREPGAAKAFDDVKREFEFVARTARTLFEADPAKTIAIFVPDLKQHYAEVERDLTRVFYPAEAMRFARTQGTRVPVAEGIFHLTEAAPLANHPLVAGALLLLELAKPRIGHAEAGAILRHPFITGAKAEKSVRALADLELRRRRELDVALSDLEYAAKNCGLLKPLWKALRNVLVNAPERQELANWSEFIGDVLAALGWPGDEPLSQSEQRIVEDWSDQVAELAALGLVCEAMTFETALGHLRRLLRGATSKGDCSSPIQVLDAVNAPGLEFDHVLITGMSDENWPPPLALSPLVPLKLQRIHEVPGSWAQSARDERRRLTCAMFCGASGTLVTYSGRISSLVEPFVRRDVVEVPHWGGLIPEQAFLKASLEELADSKAPGLAASAEARGGTGIIKAQSLCPFRAFAEYRLRAKGPDDASFGFDSLERGIFLHTALENVWQRLESQACLRATGADALRQLVREAIAEAVDSEEPGPLHQLAKRAERERLEGLILEWLELERDRKEPFTVETIEEERCYEVPGLRLKLRVDRIDRLKNGNLILIDYKSGPQSRPKLAGDRPPEPQLLVYAASLGSRVDGVFFGQLRPREVKAVGFSRAKHFKGLTAEVRTDWDDYINRARNNVEKLALDYVRGEAAVQPIKDACNFCCAKPLCRVNEAGLAPEDQE